MIEKTKITLSDKERSLVCNTDWILTKQAVIEKVYTLFGAILEPMQQSVAAQLDVLPVEINRSHAKISKGENYQGLPYVMLDYPRLFGKKDTLAIRIFFWWGIFFSISLQLSGDYQANMIRTLIDNFSTLQENDYYLCIADDPWQQQVNGDAYAKLSGYSKAAFSAILHEKDFIKITRSVPVEEWDTAPSFLLASFEEMLGWLHY